MVPYYSADGNSVSDYFMSPILMVDNLASYILNSVVAVSTAVDDGLMSVGLDMRALGCAADAHAIATGLKSIAPAIKYLSTLIKSGNTSSGFNPVKAIVQAAFGRGNIGIGAATRAEANELGKAWVGDGYRVMSDNKGLVSADKTRTYRFPSSKPNSSQATTGTQANFQRFIDGKEVSNAHLDITD